MDKGLHAAFRHLTEALQHTRDKDIVSIIPCADLFHVDTMVYMKEVAEITYKNGRKLYADIGGDANTAAMYDVLAVICGLKNPSNAIERIVPIKEEGPSWDGEYYGEDC